ncbi:MAG: translation initiation factor IF-2 [Marinilabiliales bacterium]|nr:MAG: translation initiation factor IF-2 [Marinilabiliales bacterium]
MSDKLKVIRLSKAAREFNIGLDTVVEFLSEKGFEIVKNPNTKLQPEMYAILQDEFQDEKEVKKASKERNLEFLGQGPITIKETKEKVEEEGKDEEIDIPDELLITNLGMGKKETATDTPTKSTEKPPVTEKKAEPEAETKAEQKTESKPEVKEEVTEEKPAEEKVEEVKKDEVVEERPKVEAEKKPVEEEKKAEEKVVEKEIEAEKPAEIVDKEEVKKETVEETPEPPKEEKIEKKPAKEEKVVSEKEEEEKETETVEEITEESNEPKVLGKIDLDSMNMRTRPKKKSKEEKRKEAEAKRKSSRPAKKHEDKEKQKPAVEDVEKKEVAKEKVEEKPVEEKKEEKQTDDNFIPTKHEKLTGPTVVGKIDLPKPPSKKKKPVASSSDAHGGKGKKRRKRIKPQAGAETKTTDTNKQNQHSNKNQQGNKRGKPSGNRRPEKVEPSPEDIQKKIKETLNRLSPTGKSKSSKYRRQKRDTVSEHIREERERTAEEKGTLKVTEFLTANELATMMDIGVTEIIKTCMQIGLFVSINQRLDAETIALVAEEYGFKTEFVSVDDQDTLEINEEEDKPEDLAERAPIVTVMGHVDHGKTKLLDYIRKANVVAGEAGGITQHIGAYEVTTESGKVITFLDTPGHEAFTAMRARGAKVTDIAIIVIAADDSVMPQTREAINHAQAAGVPIVFAFNKMDKPGVSSDKIKDQLSQMNILVEDWGGKFQSQEISAITGMGINDLLDKVLLEAEMLELKANPKKPGKGTVIEATLDKGRGYVSTVLVQEGTMKKGDIIIAGPVYGRVKAMFNERNKAKNIAGPSVPVVILGLNGAPQAGDVFNVMLDEKEAKNLVSKRQQLIREQSLRTQKHITLDEIGRRIAIGDFKEMNLIVKGDVDGSVEALSDELLKLSSDEVQVNVIHKAVGAITESDIMLASASDAIIIGFQVRPVPQARKLAEKEQIDIRLYSIIYQATEEIKDAVKGMLAPKMEEKIVCNIEVRDVFKITKVGTIAGCYVLDGKITRKTNVRLIRDGIVVYTGVLGSLKRFKDDVKEVSAGYECGLNIEKFNDIKVGDIVEGYEVVEVSR